MGFFEDIPFRENGKEVDSSWWNTIKTKLILAFPNIGGNSATPFTIANNQAAYVDITGFVFSSLVMTSQVARYEIYRKSDAPTERLETGIITCTYKPVAGVFSFTRRSDNDEDALNIVGDSIYVDPSTGQVQYKSDNITGANYVGKFSYSIITSFKGV